MPRRVWKGGRPIRDLHPSWTYGTDGGDLVLLEPNYLDGGQFTYLEVARYKPGEWDAVSEDPLPVPSEEPPGGPGSPPGPGSGPDTPPAPPAPPGPL